MMKTEVKKLVQNIIQGAENKPISPQKTQGQAFAPSNIALCKYWGKRNEILNLPLTNSLSVSLGHLGAMTKISELTQEENEKEREREGVGQDKIWVNQQELKNPETLYQKQNFYSRLIDFLDLFRRTPNTYFKVETEVNIPIAAGLASSACGFAALVKALSDLYGWKIDRKNLSILARLGSGSACRSLWEGFVEWEKGERADGLDSHGVHLTETFNELRIGLFIVKDTPKTLSSRLAMKNTKESSIFFPKWPERVESDLAQIKLAIKNQDFDLLGCVAEANAMAMHGLMLTAKPPISYMSPETIRVMQAIWRYRAEGLALYFTQDAGPNLKLLFLERDSETIQQYFKDVIIINPFVSCTAPNETIRDEQVNG